MSTSKPAGRRLADVPTVPEVSILPALRRLAIPVQEPRPAARVLVRTRSETVAATQGTLALSLPIDDPMPGRAETRAKKTSPRAPGAIGLLPEPSAWAATFIQAAMEVASGARSAGQLIRWTTPEVHATLVRRGALTARARRSGAPVGSKPRLRKVILCVPRPGICEVAAVIAEPERVRAVAFRMEGMHGRWRVTQIEIG